MKIIDVSGFGHSGKTTVNHLLSEVDGISAHHGSFEFNLMRLPDGILDLIKNCSTDWTAIKADIQLKRFKKLCYELDNVYYKSLSINLIKESNILIENLTYDTIKTAWYDGLFFRNKNISNLTKLINREPLSKIYRRFRKVKKLPKHNVKLVREDAVLDEVKKFLVKILSQKDRVIVMNNAFEPFDPTESLRLFDNAYSIIVDRDPRDIYLSSIYFDKLFIPSMELNNKVFDKSLLAQLKMDFLGTKNLDLFIWRQKQLRRLIKLKKDNNRVLRINYENIIFEYEKYLELIFKFLNIDLQKHTKKKLIFNPEESKKNVGLWKINSIYQCNKTEIKRIETELEDYLINDYG